MMRILPAFTVALILLTLPRYAPAQDSDRDRDASSVPAPVPGYVPLTGHQRLVQFFHYSFSPTGVLAAAAAAGISQWKDRPSEWKQGGEGYAYRFASDFGAHLVRGTLMYGAAAALHEDNRYVPLRSGSFKTRLVYAMEGAFTARHDDGSRHVSISRVTAFVGAALISRAWQPPSTDNLGAAGSSLAASAGMSAGLDVAREFWPRKR